ncbi:MAG: hypothetical protein QF464_16615, partial [Myxococcota bacterium]|nr:hypothetical protein [Myxococcota bacterium]
MTNARALGCAWVLVGCLAGGTAWAESPNCVGDEGSFVGQALELQDIAELDDGTLYAVDGEQAQIFWQSSDGLFYSVAGGQRGHADGALNEAKFMGPYGLASGGDRLYIVDTRGHRLRVLVDDQIYTVAGDGQRGFKDGPGSSARFAHPVDAVVLPSGAVLVADKLNHAIRRVIVGEDASSSVVQTVAGDGLPGAINGPTDVARLRWPVGVALGPDDSIYVADQGNFSIRRIWPEGVVTTWAGGTYGHRSASR